MNRNKQFHIINALATYICIASVRDNVILTYVNIDDIANKFCAPYDLRQKAYLKARQMVRDFY